MSKLSSIKNIILISISAIVLVGILCFILVASVRYMMGDTSERRALWRERSIAIISDMKPGLSREQVITIAQKYGSPKERIDMRNSEMYLRTPLEFGATNWVIRFGFSNNHLIYVKIRTEDNIGSERKPKGAPEDVIYSLDMNSKFGGVNPALQLKVNR
jgi:hypothetical protein